MAVYNLAPIFPPQYINLTTAAALVSPGGITAVPANQVYQIATMRVVNVTANPVVLVIYRLRPGSSADAAHTVVAAVVVPVASQTFPHFDVTALWGAVLTAGDSIWASCTTAAALVVTADGAIVTP
jgi:hypothetical protein